MVPKNLLQRVIVLSFNTLINATCILVLLVFLNALFSIPTLYSPPAGASIRGQFLVFSGIPYIYAAQTTLTHGGCLLSRLPPLRTIPGVFLVMGVVLGDAFFMALHSIGLIVLKDHKNISRTIWAALAAAAAFSFGAGLLVLSAGYFGLISYVQRPQAIIDLTDSGNLITIGAAVVLPLLAAFNIFLTQKQKGACPHSGAGEKWHHAVRVYAGICRPLSKYGFKRAQRGYNQTIALIAAEFDCDQRDVFKVLQQFLKEQMDYHTICRRAAVALNHNVLMRLMGHIEQTALCLSWPPEIFEKIRRARRIMDIEAEKDSWSSKDSHGTHPPEIVEAMRIMGFKAVPKRDMLRCRFHTLLTEYHPDIFHKNRKAEREAEQKTRLLIEAHKKLKKYLG